MQERRNSKEGREFNEKIWDILKLAIFNNNLVKKQTKFNLCYTRGPKQSNIKVRKF